MYLKFSLRISFYHLFDKDVMLGILFSLDDFSKGMILSSF